MIAACFTVTLLIEDHRPAPAALSARWRRR